LFKEDRLCQEVIVEKRYRVTLLEDERQELQSMVSVGKAAARKLVRARILLLADQAEGGPGKKDPEIADALGCGRMTIARTRKQFVEEGMDATLDEASKQLIAEVRQARNSNESKIDWRFTTADARIKLKRLYPSIHD
jgi:hypothetical protein